MGEVDPRILLTKILQKGYFGSDTYGARQPRGKVGFGRDLERGPVGRFSPEPLVFLNFTANSSPFLKFFDNVRPCKVGPPTVSMTLPSSRKNEIL